jgi:hypothetical protein
LLASGSCTGTGPLGAAPLLDELAESADCGEVEPGVVEEGCAGADVVVLEPAVVEGVVDEGVDVLGLCALGVFAVCEEEDVCA